MDEMKLTALLESVRQGEYTVEEAVEALKYWPSEMLDFACLDHHRWLRTGLPEAVYGENKSAEQISEILGKNTYDFERVPIDGHDLADNGGISTEFSLPEAVAGHDV